MTRYKSITLYDSRKLSYIEYGKMNGIPVLYFHGAPSSALEPLLINEELFIAHNLRIIVPERPGIGNSDYQVNRNFTDWINDVIALANYLKLSKFAVIGISCGCAYALACAAKIPKKLTAAIIVSGAWKMNHMMAKKHMKKPFSIFWKIVDKAHFLLPVMFSSLKFSHKLSNTQKNTILKKAMPPADYLSFEVNNTVEDLFKTMAKGAKNIKGLIRDVRLYVKPLDFNLEEICFPVTFFMAKMMKMCHCL